MVTISVDSPTFDSNGVKLNFTQELDLYIIVANKFHLEKAN